MITYNFLSAECGAGKTTAIINKMAKEKGRYVYAAPTIRTLNQTLENLKKAAPSFRCILINNEISTATVPEQLLSAKTEIDDLYNDVPVTIFVTHAALTLCDWSPFTAFNLIVDEITEPVRIWAEDFRTHKDVLARYLQLETPDEVVSRVIPTSEGNLLLTSGNYDKVQKAVRDLLELSARKRSTLYAMSESWNDYRTQKHFIHSFEPSIFQDFASVLMVGDDFERSILYRIWSKEIHFQAANIQMRKRKVPLFDRATITYFSDRNASMTFFNSKDDPLMQIGKKLQDRDVEFWTTNADYRGKLSRLLSSEQFVSPKAHGQNHLMNRTSVAWLCALKPANDDAAVYELLYSISRTELVEWREHNAMYQFVMRSALRDFDSQEPVKVYVFDRAQAEYLADRFGLSEGSISCDPVTIQPTQPRNKKVAMTNAERVRKHREMKKWKTMMDAQFGR